MYNTIDLQPPSIIFDSDKQQPLPFRMYTRSTPTSHIIIARSYILFLSSSLPPPNPIQPTTPETLSRVPRLNPYVYRLFNLSPIKFIIFSLLLSILYVHDLIYYRQQYIRNIKQRRTYSDDNNNDRNQTLPTYLHFYVIPVRKYFFFFFF